jgi:putative ABC transport system permease protein
MDWRVMAFTAAIAILTGVIFGLAPALHASKIDLTESLKSAGQQSGTSSSRLRNTLAIAEIAVAVVLVVGAGLLVKSLWKLAHVNPGFRTESVVTARITPNDQFCADFGRCQSLYNELLSRVKALPGVQDATIASSVPLEMHRVAAFAADVEGHPRNPRDPLRCFRKKS